MRYKSKLLTGPSGVYNWTVSGVSNKLTVSGVTYPISCKHIVSVSQAGSAQITNMNFIFLIDWVFVFNFYYFCPVLWRFAQCLAIIPSIYTYRCIVRRQFFCYFFFFFKVLQTMEKKWQRSFWSYEICTDGGNIDFAFRTAELVQFTFVCWVTSERSDIHFSNVNEGVSLKNDLKTWTPVSNDKH